MSADELVVSPEVFPSIRAGDLLFMWDPALSSATSSSSAAATAGSNGGGAVLSPSPPPPLISARRRRRREQERGALLLAVSRLHGPPPSAPSVAPAKGSGFAGNLNYMNTLQISLSNKIADLFGFVQRQAIAAEVLTPETAPQVDFVEVVFRDQYVGRSDMWRLQLSLIGSPIYIQKPISFSCIRATVSELLRKGKPVRSGFVTRDTKFVFRSRSAKFYLLIQMSSEMWDFAEDGELYFEKVNLFLRSMFSKWKASSANHTLCLVLFSRLYLAEDAKLEGNLGELQTDPDGLQYRDFYKVLLLDEKKSDWESVILQLKREFIQYPRSLRWDPHADGAQPCYNSTARKGNLLEAINLALLDLDKDFIDRDLKQTGQGIVAISGGSGHFEVCAKMMQMTKQKIIDHGIGCDLICLSKPPLHMVPLFECRPPLRRASSATGVGGGGGGGSQDALALSRDEGPSAGGVGKLGFNTPHWIYISFFNPRASSAPAAWEARCRMPQLQYHYSTNVLDELRCGRADVVVTVKSGAAVCGPEEARKERREDPRLDDAYFDSYDSSVFSIDASPALSSFPGKHSLGRDAIGPFGPRKQHHPNTNHHHHHQHTKLHRPLHPPTHLAELPESYPSTTPGTDPFLSSGSDTAMKPVRLPYAHPHGNHEDGNNTHAGATTTSSSSKDPPNRGARDQSQSQSSVKTTPHPRSATTSASTTTTTTTTSSSSSTSTGVTAAIAITSATSATMTAIGTTAAPSTGPSPGSALSVRRASVAIAPPSTLAWTGSSLATAAPQSSAQLPPHSNAAAAAASLKVSQAPPAQHVPPSASLKAKFKKTNACLNPFQPLVAEGPGGLESDPEGYSSNKRRWSHLFHTSIYRTVGHKEYTYAPNWKSLCEPASLPITTDYKPTPSELNTRFAEGNHTLNADDAGPYRSRTEELLRELVSQRLVQGYQLVVPPKPRKDLKPQKPHPKEKPGAVSSSSSSDKSSYTVSMGNDYHEFAKEGQNIRVKRYHKKDDRRIRTGGAGIVYSYQLMGLGEERWAGMRVSFNHKASAQYSWNYLDQLICGYSDDMYDTLKYSTVKYVLAPVQTADVEERAVRSFLAFAKALAAKEDSKLNVQILSKFAMVDDSENKERPARMKPDEVDRILGAMRHPISGLTPLIRDRRWRFRNYKSCFVGSDCVEWFLKNVDIENRRAAEELGQRILELGFVEHVAGKAQFKDGNYYYRLHEDSPTATLPASGKPDSPLKDPSPNPGQQQRSASLLKKQLAEYIGSAPPPGGTITPPATPVASRSNTLDAVAAGTAASLAPPVVLGAGSASPSPQQGKAEQKPPTHTLKIEIPPTKTDRYEWLYMVYDGVYNPYEWFHVEFQWLVCTGCVVDDFLSMLERKAKNLGLRWIPIPVYLMDRSKKTNGFMGAFEIPLACSVRDLGTMVILQQEILALCDFLLDKASGDQYYIHKTGMLFAQITCEGFLCSLNTLPGARHKLSKGMKMLQYLRDFCTDAERVEALLGQLLNPRMSPRSFDDRDHDLLLENETDGEDSEERQLESDRQKLRQPAPVMVVPKKGPGPLKPARVFSSPGPLSPTLLSSAAPSSSSSLWLPASSPSHTASVGPSRHQQHQQQEEPSASPPATHHPRPDLGVLPLAPPAAAAESTPADDDSSGEGSSSYNALLYYCVLHRGRGSTTGGGGGDGTSHQPLPPAVDVSARWRSLNFLPAPGLST